MTDRSQNPYEIQNIDCPSCQSDGANVVSHVMDIPYYDDFIMVGVSCSKCGFRSSDFYNMHSKGHTRFIYKVDDISDDSTKVVRSVEGTVSIPEIDVKIEPYGGGLSWIRNIEGVLQDIHQKLLIVLRDEEDRSSIDKIERRIEKLMQLMKYEISFTIIVDDPTGNSLILPADEKKLEITIINDGL
ncbi:MAG: ZPR1 zinc finger domain-containing protein [Candidatus Heimdallarchaeota archaeon]|nr:ZPR1 zinc finger domain-containing protein [Candidatus Heimdallarchaeota archaeon]